MTRLRATLAIGVLLTCLTGGCSTAPAPVDPIDPGLPGDLVFNEVTFDCPRAEPVLPEFNSARSAAQVVASLPEPVEPEDRRIVQFHVAMFREAYLISQSSLGRFVLTAPDGRPSSWSGRWGSMPEREFRIRVLAELNDLLVPMAWSIPDDNPENPFPHTGLPSTRLFFRYQTVKPLDIIAEIGQLSPDGSVSRQQVRARWTDDRWVIARSGVLVIE